MKQLGWALIAALGVCACDGTKGADDGGVDGRVEQPDGATTADAGPAAVCAAASDCDDGDYCNGLETCAPGDEGAGADGCVPGESPCEAGHTCDEAANQCVSPDCTEPDADLDGHDKIGCGSGDDCDDTDADRFPGNAEICDPDNHDEDCNPSTFGSTDGDGDGYVSALCCNVGTSGEMICGDDCNDASAQAHPSEAETCDMLDNDCDGMTDEGMLHTYYVDADGDDFGVESMATQACTRPGAGYADQAGDCDDTESSRNPGLAEVCDGLDNDCDTTTDEGVLHTYYEDGDGDGHGLATASMQACSLPAGYAMVGDDCNDAAPNIYPTAPEACNGISDDCDAAVDEGVLETFYFDADGDDYGVTSMVMMACGPVGQYRGTMPGDCDDARAEVRPGAPELCDGFDNDCSGGLNYPGEDNDGDGYADAAVCTEAPLATDCDDTDPAIHVGATEIPGDSVDQNCDGQELCFADADDDGYRPNATATVVSVDTDCDDSGEANGSHPTTDCCDSDELAYPGSVGDFEPRGCGGGYDYDCDGSPTRRETAVATGTCPSGFGAACDSGGTRTAGWVGTVPDCGEVGQWYPGGCRGGELCTPTCIALCGDFAEQAVRQSCF